MYSSGLLILAAIVAMLATIALNVVTFIGKDEGKEESPRLKMLGIAGCACAGVFFSYLIMVLTNSFLESTRQTLPYLIASVAGSLVSLTLGGPHRFVGASSCIAGVLALWLNVSVLAPFGAGLLAAGAGIAIPLVVRKPTAALLTQPLAEEPATPSPPPAQPLLAEVAEATPEIGPTDN
jgi:hypothetical protein